MEPTKIVPELDMAVLQQKANEYAMKGCIESIKEYYTGYNSAFRKKIDEELTKQEFGWSLELPDILALLNESLTKEMDLIANAAVKHTYIPMMQRLLTRMDKEVNFSDILKEFIECVEPKYMDDCEVFIEENIQYEWLNVTIEHERGTYELTLHLDRESKKKGEKKYTIFSLPRNSGENSSKDKMTFTMDGGSLEMPFQKDVLKDKFLSYIARIIICESVITIDTNSFDESMFPERCHCH